MKTISVAKDYRSAAWIAYAYAFASVVVLSLALFFQNDGLRPGGGDGIALAIIAALMLVFAALLAACMTSVPTLKRHFVVLTASAGIWLLTLVVLIAPEL